MKHGLVTAALLCLLCILLCAAAQADAVVGTDIMAEDITDFYYTVDSSAWPPVYLRYRLCPQGGGFSLIHESRQGIDWPLTEADTVFSGTAVLGAEDWAALFDCLRDGTVRPRSDEAAGGDAGPWTYLYCDGQDGEFTFASPEKRAAFAKLCGILAQNHVLTRFRLTRGGSMVPLTREVFRKDGAYWLSENDGPARPFDPSLAEELQQAADEYGLLGWNGFHGSDPRVLDGESFSLEAVWADGDAASASGTNAFPKGYHAAMNSLEEIFTREQLLRAAGTYRYAGEGIGGDFTITLNPDGTYTFYEGPLSSYLGGGSWELFYGVVYMQEENGYELQFAFGTQDGALIYLADSSDRFPYVALADGARFIRQEEENGMQLTIGGTAVPVTWEDNEAVAALRELLPLTVSLSMYGGFEQVGPLGKSLPRNDSQIVTEAGDIVLYSGNQIVVFYGSNAWSYTRLGHVELSPEEMAGLLAHGDVTLTLTSD